MHLLAFFLLLLSSASLTSSTPAPAPTTTAESPVSTNFQVLYFKNAKPFVLLDHYDHHPHHRHQMRVMNGGKKKKKTGAAETWGKRRNTRRPFYVMLPKGFVPPSGSSPCHNLYPESVHLDHFECRYVAKTTTVKP